MEGEVEQTVPMRRHPRRGRSPQSGFMGFRFPPDVIMVAVRWYLRYGLSYRDVEELLAERGISVDHVTIDRWVQRFTLLLIDAARPGRHAPGANTLVEVLGDLPLALEQAAAYLTKPSCRPPITCDYSPRAPLTCTPGPGSGPPTHHCHPLVAIAGVAERVVLPVMMVIGVT